MVSLCYLHFVFSMKKHPLAHLSIQSYINSMMCAYTTSAWMSLESRTMVLECLNPLIATKHATSKFTCFEDIYHGDNSKNNKGNATDNEHVNDVDNVNGGDTARKTNNGNAATWLEAIARARRNCHIRLSPQRKRQYYPNFLSHMPHVLVILLPPETQCYSHYLCLSHEQPYRQLPGCSSHPKGHQKQGL